MKKFAIYSTDSQSFLNHDGNFGDWNQTADEVKTFDSEEEAENYLEKMQWVNPCLSVGSIKYAVCCREIGEELEHCDTYEEAVKLVESFENEDKSNKTYHPDFYEITVTGA